MPSDLFAHHAQPQERLDLVPGAVLFRGRLRDEAPALLAELTAILAQAPLRQRVTPGGFTMSVAMSNCGPLGWVTDLQGYRYSPVEPETGIPWPPMPPSWQAVARAAAQAAGFPDFTPDACLINRYAPGARMSLHQDRDEADLTQPIVSFSFGLPATFLFGGLKRADKPEKLLLEHGDVLVWGGPARLRYHGIQPLQEGNHPLTGPCRLNLTFRRAQPVPPAHPLAQG